MNEIKYRIYGKENRIMYSWEEILNFDSLKDTLKNGGKEDQYYSPLLQYTEVRDSQGAEIYAGDICKRTVFAFGESRTFVGQVMMFEGCWWIDSGTAAVPLWNEMHILETVGNIYENPELLKNETK